METIGEDEIPMYTLDNGVKIYSSGSNGQVSTSSNFSTGSDVEVCGGDAGKYAFTSQHMILKFPKNVSGFKIFGTGSTQRSISKVYSHPTAGTNVQIKNVGTEHTGTFTGDKEQTAGKWCQYVEAVFDANNIIAKDEYVYVNLNGSMYAYRVIFTEAECTTPTVTLADKSAYAGSEVTLTAEASALGASYTWYRCTSSTGANPQVIDGETTASYTFTKAAGDEFFKVVVACNCSDETAEDVATVAERVDVTLQDVTGSITWDFANAVSTNVNITATPVVLANYPAVTNDATFESDKLEASGEKFTAGSNANLRANYIRFHTTVPGKLSISYSNTGGSNPARYIYVNGVKYDEEGSASTTKKGIDTKVFVPAGDVELVMKDGEDASKNVQIYQMIFNATPDYERNVSSNYGTLCVEHNVLVGGAPGATFYQIASRNEDYDYKIDFEEVLPNEELKAGEPYLFKSNTGKIELFYGEETAATPKPVRGMIGNYEATTLEITTANMNTIYYFAQNKLWLCDNLVGSNLILNDHRAYIDLTQVPTYADYEATKQQQQNSAPRRRVSLEMNGEKIATGCENLNVSDKPVKMIINGQLFILRGEKMYDAKGQLVK
jgi:hypothetical protein